MPLNHSREETNNVEHFNNYFTSDNHYKIIEFYESFMNRDQLIQWMKERPTGIAQIHEIEGDKEVIVVIPTADFNGRYAKECRDNIFNGLHIIFVESGKYPDQYFNYAHNCNVGINKAMEYNPKWVIVTNDDMYKIDDISRLKSILKKINENEISLVLASPSFYHSRHEIVGKINTLAYLYYMRNKQSREMFRLKKRFQILFSNAPDKFFARFFLGKRRKIINIIDFAIFSSLFVRDCGSRVFDENFINHFEDTELSLRIINESRKILVSDYQIGSVIGSTLGGSYIRDLRTIPSLAYFSQKYEDRW